MVLPFALWGTAMAAMTPLVSSAGPLVVASMRLLPAGFVLLIAVLSLGRRLTIASSDLGWFLIFTFIDASIFQLCLARGLAETGAGIRIADEEGLRKVLAGLLQDEGKRIAMGAAARRWKEGMQGASDKTFDLLLNLLEGHPSQAG